MGTNHICPKKTTHYQGSSQSSDVKMRDIMSDHNNFLYHEEQTKWFKKLDAEGITRTNLTLLITLSALSFRWWLNR